VRESTLEEERRVADAGVECPSVLEKSAAEPTAVLKFAFPFPVMSLFRSAESPNGSVIRSMNIL